MDFPWAYNTIMGSVSQSQMKVIPLCNTSSSNSQQKMVLWLFGEINSSPKIATTHKSRTRENPPQHLSVIVPPSKKNKSKSINFLRKLRDLYKRFSSTVSSIPCFSIIYEICFFIHDIQESKLPKRHGHPKGSKQSNATMINSCKHKTITSRISASEGAQHIKRLGVSEEAQKIKRLSVFEEAPANQKTGGLRSSPANQKTGASEGATSSQRTWRFQENHKKSRIRKSIRILTKCKSIATWPQQNHLSTQTFWRHAIPNGKNK